MTLDEVVAGEFYISRGKRIYKTNDHGNSFSLIDSLNYEIIGLYKKPASDTLYAATKYDIYEITSDTIRSIKNITVSVEIRQPELPSSFVLYQNYPNPFNPSTTIPFSIPEPATVTIEVYDIIGRLVSRITDDRYDPGYHTVSFDARRITSGTYIIVMRVSDIGGSANRSKIFNQRVVLVK